MSSTESERSAAYWMNRMKATAKEAWEALKDTEEYKAAVEGTTSKEEAMEIMTYHDAEKKILEHYGRHKQELQAIQELTELILLLAARPDQRGDNYEQNILSELADVQIMCEQIQIMHKISNAAIADMKAYKLRRQLARIEKEDEEE